LNEQQEQGRTQEQQWTTEGQTFGKSSCEPEEKDKSNNQHKVAYRYEPYGNTTNKRRPGDGSVVDAESNDMRKNGTGASQMH
jgi:YD repeat-containing protein